MIAIHWFVRALRKNVTEGGWVKNLNFASVRPHFFFLFLVETSTLHDARRFQKKKRKKKDTEHERVHFIGKTEHEREAPHARRTD